MPKSTNAKPGKPTRRNMGIYLEQDLLDWLAGEAKKEDRPVSQLARILIKEAREIREARQPAAAAR